MDLYVLIGIGLIAAFLAMLLRQYRAELGIAVELACGLLLLLYAVVNLLPVLQELRGITDKGSLPAALLAVVLKVLGVCYLTQFAADLCSDAGETALAGKLTFAGKVMVLVLSLPLFRQLLGIITALLGEG